MNNLNFTWALFLFLISYSGIAQDTANVKFLNGEEFNLLLKKRDFTSKKETFNPITCEIVGSKSSKTIIFKDIKSIAYESDYYERLFPFNSSKKKKGIIARREIEGKIDLFKWEKVKVGGSGGYSTASPSGYGTTTYYSSTKSKTITKYFIKKNGQVTEITNENFKSSILPIIDDCEKLANKVKANQFKFMEINRIVFFYNQNCN